MKNVAGSKLGRERAIVSLSADTTAPRSVADESSVFATQHEKVEPISNISDQVVLLPTIRREPLNPARAVESMDMGYFSFFLQEMVQIALDFKEIFPTYIRDSFAYSVDSNALRHSVLAASAMIVDKRQGKDMVRFHHHRQETFRNIRQQLALGEYNVSLAAAVFWTTYMDMLYGDFDAALKHIRGLYLVLQHLLKGENGIWQGGVASNIPPLCKLMWRFGRRSDIIMSHWMNGEKLVYPTIPREEEHLHRGWMEIYTRAASNEDGVEWATASFALECFMHRSCYIANDFLKFRLPEGTFPPAISTEFEKVKQALIRELLEWWKRPVIQKARSEEILLSVIAPPPPVSQPTFLDYPPFPLFHDALFVSLRNLWYANYIYVSILNCAAGQQRSHDALRIRYATEICRVFAAQGRRNFPAFDLICVIFAAVAFAESAVYERESRWIQEKMMGCDGPGRNWAIIPRLFTRMGELWGKQYYEWEEVLPGFDVGD